MKTEVLAEAKRERIYKESILLFLKMKFKELKFPRTFFSKFLRNGFCKKTEDG